MKTLSRDSKAARTSRFYDAMAKLGFTYAETEVLRLAEKTLHRWAERECNGEIERDEKTGIVRYSFRGQGTEGAVCPDRETGAIHRIAKAVSDRNTRENAGYGTPEFIHWYHQTDPRGCALYLVKKSDVPEGADIGSYYTRGFAVYI